MAEITPPKGGSSYWKIALYIAVISLTALYSLLSCTSLRYGVSHRTPEGDKTLIWYDSTVINKSNNLNHD